MKATELKTKVFHCFLALTLTLGLMVPTFNSTAYGEPNDAAQSASQTSDPATDDAGASGEALSAPAASPNAGVDSANQGAEAGTDNAGEATDGTGGSTAAETDGADGTGTGTGNGTGTGTGNGTGNGSDGTDAADADAAQDAAATDAAQDAGQQVQMRAVTDWTTVASSSKLQVKGEDLKIGNASVPDCDVYYDNGVLVINSSKTIHLRTTAASTVDTIQVPAGKTANLVFEGVDLTSSTRSALNLVPGATCHIVLADGSNNRLITSASQKCGIHAGTTSTLTIDDAVPNVARNGNKTVPLVPQDGRIPAGTVYVGYDGVERTAGADGDPLTRLDSLNPGRLTAQSESMGSAIGGVRSEDGGNMTFNGGIISATCRNSSTGHATGIGAGSSAAGTSPDEWIVFNGGRVTAQGAYHGAGIGGGYNTTQALDPDGKVVSKHPHGTGNIRINGGYIVSNGGFHGNGFGRACYGSMLTCNNKDYTIMITGGTMIPTGGEGLGESMDIGGAGTNGSSSAVASMAANIIITGGSVKVSTRNNRFRFDGTAYGAYDMVDGKPVPRTDSEVNLVQINLTAQIGAAAQNPIVNWRLYVGGERRAYGAPSMFDNGYLYLWLPKSDIDTKKISVDLSYNQVDANGKPVVNEDGSEAIEVMDRLYRDPNDTAGTPLKAYSGIVLTGESGLFENSGYTMSAISLPENFDKTDDTLKEDGTVDAVIKYYDGTPYQPREITQANPLYSTESTPKPLYKDIVYTYQQLNVDKGELGADAQNGDGSVMPEDTGIMKFAVTSAQWVGETVQGPGDTTLKFGDMYRGHRGYGWCVINPVNSRATTEGVTIDYNGQEVEGARWIQDEVTAGGMTVSTNHLVVPVDVTSGTIPGTDTMTASTCKAPDGTLQLYIDGKPVPARYGGVITFENQLQTADDGTPIKEGNGFKYQMVHTNEREGVTPAVDVVSVVKDPADGNREHTRVVFDLSMSDLNGFGLADKGDEDHVVTVKYLSKQNAGDLGQLSEQDIEQSQMKAASIKAFSAAQELSDQAPATITPLAGEAADGAAAAIAAAREGLHNYYGSVSKSQAIQIQTIEPYFEVYNEHGTAYDPEDEDGTDAAPSKDASDAAEPKWRITDGETDEAGNQTVKPNNEFLYDFAEFDGLKNRQPGDDPNAEQEPDDTEKDWFSVYLETQSLDDVTFTSSNPAVATVDPASVTNRAENEYTPGDTQDTLYSVGARVYVTAPGKTIITAKVAGNGIYRSVSRSFTIYVYPDLTAKPQLELVETSRNLTHRDGTIRPGDTLQYTTKATNTVTESVYQNPDFTLTIPAGTTFKGLKIQTPEGQDLPLEEGKDYTVKDGKVQIQAIPSIYGDQTYTIRMDVTVDDSVIEPGTEIDKFPSETDVTGFYGIGFETFEWDKRIDTLGGEKADPAESDADPTSEQEPEAEPTITDKNVGEVLGGELIEQPDPEDPDNPGSGTPGTEPGGEDPDKPAGVDVGPVKPDSPLDKATADPDPDDPDAGEDPVPNPIKPGDVITSFGEADNPQTPEDVAKELRRIIEEAIADNENLPDDEKADHVDVPVTIQTKDPDTGEWVETDVTVPVPIPTDYTPAPDAPDPDGTEPEPDDHNLIVVPRDPVIDPSDPGTDPDDPDNPDGPGTDPQPGKAKSSLVTTKTVENVTEGFADRKNQSHWLVGDVVRYTVKVENTLAGSAAYDVKVKDPLPETIEYVPGTAVITDQFGTQVKIEGDADRYDANARVLGFSLGNLVGKRFATVTFDAKILPGAVEDGAEVPANIANVYLTTPTETLVYPEGVDPDDPGYEPAVKGGPTSEPPHTDPGSYDPADEDKVWEEDFDDPKKPGVDPSDPAAPEGTTHSDPDHGKFTTAKTATILTDHADEEGYEKDSLYVDDEVQYRIVFTNSDERWTEWYNVALYDKLPAGMEPVPGTFKMLLPGSEEPVALDDSVYNAQEGDIAVYVGRVLGGQSVTLEFVCKVTEAALNNDVGNTASVGGTDPSATEPSVLDGDPSATPGVGKRYVPEKGWEGFFDELGEKGSYSSVAYPNGISGIQAKAKPGTEQGPTGGQPEGPGSDDEQNGPGSAGNGGGDDAGLAKADKNAQDGQADGLAKTGDAAPLAALAFASVIALAVMAAMRRRNRDRA